MRNDIYDKFGKAFYYVSAHAAIYEGQFVKIAFKYPKDGAGRLTCYLHVVGEVMVHGTASGYGYDKASAAMYDAVMKLKGDDKTEKALKDIAHKFDSSGWRDSMKESGFEIYSIM